MNLIFERVQPFNIRYSSAIIPRPELPGGVDWPDFCGWCPLIARLTNPWLHQSSIKTQVPRAPLFFNSESYCFFCLQKAKKQHCASSRQTQAYGKLTMNVETVKTPEPRQHHCSRFNEFKSTDPWTLKTGRAVNTGDPDESEGQRC